MGHKYLKQFNLIKNFPNSLLKFDKRRLKWLVQRIKYGIDERATWDLDNTFYAWLYEHLCAYKQYAPIDLDYHTCEYEGVTYTQGEIILKRGGAATRTLCLAPVSCGKGDTL